MKLWGRRTSSSPMASASPMASSSNITSSVGRKPDPLAFLGSSDFPADREETIQNIKLIIRIRWFISPIVLLILIIASRVGLAAMDTFSAGQLIINVVNTSGIILLNLIYVVLVKRISNLRLLVYFQLFLDALHFSLTVYRTGAVSSPMTFLYFGVIFAGAVLVSGRAGYISAAICSVLFSAVILLELNDIIPHQDYFIPLSGLHIVYSYLTLCWIFNIFSFFIMAALASFLTGEIRGRRLQLQEANAVLDKKISTLLLLYRTAKALNSYRTVKEAADYILSELLEYLSLDRALLYVNINDDHLHLYMVKHSPHVLDGRVLPDGDGWLNVDIPLKAEAGLTARAALEKQAYNVRHPEESEFINRELALKIGLNPFAVAPLVVRDRLVGVIGIDRSFENGWINEEEFQVLLMFANQAGLTIQSLAGDVSSIL